MTDPRLNWNSSTPKPRAWIFSLKFSLLFANIIFFYVNLAFFSFSLDSCSLHSGWKESKSFVDRRSDWIVPEQLSMDEQKVSARVALLKQTSNSTTVPMNPKPTDALPCISSGDALHFLHLFSAILHMLIFYGVALENSKVLLSIALTPLFALVPRLLIGSFKLHVALWLFLLALNAILCFACATRFQKSLVPIASSSRGNSLNSSLFRSTRGSLRITSNRLMSSNFRLDNSPPPSYAEV